MYKRQICGFTHKIIKKYPVLTIIGPRQSGKSTFCRTNFPSFNYVSLETFFDYEMAKNDPIGFFNKYPAPLIIDEVHRVPELLSDLQTIVDDPHFKSHYILTGSHQLMLMESITQSLAGRTTILNLLPLSLSELKQKSVKPNLDERLYYGGYPRIYDKQLNPTQWLDQYIKTYVERDVRQLTQVKDLDVFQRFLGLCAGRVGQLLNLESLSNDCGVSGPTIKSWLSILEASFIIFKLKPHFKNFGKRLIKSPKIYFYDTGLLCNLLKINDPNHLTNHPLRGSIFENFVILELVKNYANQGKEPDFYFWRDSQGHEVDLIINQSQKLYPIEIKSSQTFQRDFLTETKHLNELQNVQSDDQGQLIYGGSETFSTQGYAVQSWWDL